MRVLSSGPAKGGAAATPSIVYRARKLGRRAARHKAWGAGRREANDGGWSTDRCRAVAIEVGLRPNLMIDAMLYIYSVLTLPPRAVAVEVGHVEETRRGGLDLHELRELQ